MTSGDGARGRNDAIPVNQAQSGFQPGTLTDANPPRPAGDVSNLASAVPCLGVELAITGDSTLPRFTTRAELEALAREHGWSVQWGTANWSDVIRRVTSADSKLTEANNGK